MEGAGVQVLQSGVKYLYLTDLTDRLLPSSFSNERTEENQFISGDPLPVPYKRNELTRIGIRNESESDVESSSCVRAPTYLLFC